MAPSGISVNKPVALGIIILVAGGIVFYRWGWISSPFSSKMSEQSKEGQQAEADLKNQDREVQVSKLAAAPVQGVEEVKVTEVTIDLTVANKKMTVFSRQTTPKAAAATAAAAAKVTVLLLHGKAFTSKDWSDIKTLHYLALWGYKAVAVDLPGLGKSTGTLEEAAAGKELFMQALVAALGQGQVVIVSPSMSGGYSLPYLFSDAALKSPPSTVVGFVPVAPVQTADFTQNYLKSQLPTLVVVGEDDKVLGAASRTNLQRLPKSRVAVIPKAGHACYMNQPALFHNALYDFLHHLKKD